VTEKCVVKATDTSCQI